MTYSIIKILFVTADKIAYVDIYDTKPHYCCNMIYRKRYAVYQEDYVKIDTNDKNYEVETIKNMYIKELKHREFIKHRKNIKDIESIDIEKLKSQEHDRYKNALEYFDNIE